MSARNCVRINGQAMRGITRIAKKRFYPSYRYPRTLATSHGGKRLGKRIDRELQGVVHDRVRGLCVETQAILAYLKTHRLALTGAQVPVAHVPARIGTKLDLLCHDTDGKAVVVEIKSGYVGYKYVATKRMRAPLHHLTDCPLNQHCLQVMLTAWLFQDTFTKPCTALLLYVSGATVAAHHVECQDVNLKNQVYSALKQ